MGIHAVGSMKSLHSCLYGYFVYVPMVPSMGWSMTKAFCYQLAESFSLLGFVVPLVQWNLSDMH